MVAHRPAIDRALQFIAEHLERPLTVAEVARAAGLSEFHLHRLFHAAVGESIGRFVTRRRLEVAALRLSYQAHRSITDIALSSGYSSSSNFTKAFTAYFGCSPSEVRDPARAPPRRLGTLRARHGKDFSPAALYTLGPEAPAAVVAGEAARWQERVRFVGAAARPLACLAGPGGYEPEAIGATWTELIRRARELGLCKDEVDAWGIVHDSPDITATEHCRYHAGVPCPPEAELAPPLFARAIPAGRYAVFDYAGAVTDIGDAYRSIYSCWFRQSSVAPADFTPFDHYVGDFPEGGQVVMELWFRVEPKGAIAG